MSKFKLNEKGFIFIETIFLTLIVSFTAIIIFNGLNLAMKSNRISVIRMNAIHLASARIAEIEAHNRDKSSFQLPTNTFLTSDDLIYEDFFGIDGTLKFILEDKINTSASDHVNVTVRVTWAVNNNNEYGIGNDRNYEEITKDIWIVQDDPGT